jgi:hypothetical protein
MHNTWCPSNSGAANNIKILLENDNFHFEEAMGL